MWWFFSANMVLPFGVIVLLIMTMPLHTKYLRGPVQQFVQMILDMQFFGMKAFGEPITLFHAVELVYGILFISLAGWGHHRNTADLDEDFSRKMSRWHRERNMYISAFIFVTYLMIFQYHNLRRKYDVLKKEKELRDAAAAAAKRDN
eukprot:TRINITY_DN30_c0_g1_i1.p1 TRINITY_DN30_c0_g1~~TRINITY_DN30_c0_g1_i1.p1  ORF type:complete len:147 (-),score=35.58 TRINITY_DN30_c0_g1_i1:68-508(-)